MSRRYNLTKILPKRSERWAGRRAYLMMLAVVAIFLAVESPLVKSTPFSYPVTFPMAIHPPTCVTPPTGLVSWWAGDENANDIHGDNDGTLENGATFTPGLVGQAFNLDGDDDLILVPHNSNLAFGSGQDFTIDAWINLQSPTLGNDDVIVGKGDDQNHRVGVSPNTYRLWVFRDSHAVRFDLIANDVVFSLYSNTPVPLNEWTHVSAVREGIMGYIYINGVLDASAVMTADSVANADPLTIGGIYDTLFDPPVQPLEGFGGLIDEVEIYNRALSALEIQEIFNAGSAGKCKTVTAPQLTELGPTNIWLGLKNSDDVGTKFDLLAEVLKNGSLIGSGQRNGVPGGSSGFNNAVLRSIDLVLSSPVSVGAGDTLSIRLSVRIAVGVSGHRSGTARLWFNDSTANSRFGATIGGATNDYFILDGYALGTASGAGPKKTIDVLVDRAAGGNPFKPFGTWSKAF